jgi:molybdate transport system ATP-binding protein
LPEPTTPKTPHHHLAVRGHAGPLELDIDLTLAAPWTVIYGPSGSGKSTLLKAACGLIPSLTVLFERRSQARQTPDNHWTPISAVDVNIPPHRRDLGYAPQSASLFPHLSVRENIFFATRTRPASEANEALAEQTLTLFDLARLADRRPHQLSGGEQQRVNLARACAVPNAQLLLFDEPFAGADRALRDDLLTRLQPWLASRNLPVLSVTHDVDEVFLLRAEVVLIDNGHVLDQGTATEMLSTERTRILRTLGEGA